MPVRRERQEFWIERGPYAVRVEVDVIYPSDFPREACLEPATSRFLDEVASHAEAGDLDYLRQVGRVFVNVDEQATGPAVPV